MAETIFDRINVTLDTLDEQLKEANAVILDRQRIYGTYKMTKLMAAKTHPIAKELRQRATYHADRINRDEYEQFLATIDSIPVIVGRLETATQKVSGWRISVGQIIASIVRRIYRLLKADLPDMPEIKPFHDMVAECFPQPGPRKNNNNGNNGDGGNDNSNTGTDAAGDSSPDNPA